MFLNRAVIAKSQINVASPLHTHKKRLTHYTALTRPRRKIGRADVLSTLRVSRTSAAASFAATVSLISSSWWSFDGEGVVMD